MVDKEEFVASLQALLVRYNLSVVQCGGYCYLKDSDGAVYSMDEFLLRMDRVDSV